MLFWLSFEIFSDFQTPMKFSQTNLNVWFSPVSQSLPGISWGNKLFNAHNYRKIQTRVLKSKKIAENQKIQSLLKNSKCYKIWTKRGIGLKFSGFASFNDPCQWSKFEANWRVSIPDLTWSWLDSPKTFLLGMLNQSYMQNVLLGIKENL